MSIKVSVRRKSENFSPDGGAPEVMEFQTLKEALQTVWDTTEDTDIKVSRNGANSCIVGLGVDYDFEIQDMKEDEDQ
jgi:hypothetical protein